MGSNPIEDWNCSGFFSANWQVICKDHDCVLIFNLLVKWNLIFNHKLYHTNNPAFFKNVLPSLSTKNCVFISSNSSEISLEISLENLKTCSFLANFLWDYYVVLLKCEHFLIVLFCFIYSLNRSTTEVHCVVDGTFIREVSIRILFR